MKRRDFLMGAALAVPLSSPPLLTRAQAAGAARFRAAWPGTDFTRTAVPLDEIFSGGPPKDGIPALDEVSFIGATAADGLGATEPVLTVALDGSAERAYPLRYLIWHEIANDRIGGVPVAVTYCPLCNSALVFDRRVQGRELSFGVSGLLRNSDMVMYDRQTESWWQQFTGAAIVGELMGQTLTQLVSWLEPLSAFAARNPGGALMAEPTGYRRRYGENPYAGYDSSARPFLYRGEAPPHGIPPLMRVVRVGNRAWPYTRFEAGAETVTIEEAGLRITWQSRMSSALDTRRIDAGRDVGFVRVVDAATGRDVVHEVVFAFAFHAFQPDGEWMMGNN